MNSIHIYKTATSGEYLDQDGWRLSLTDRDSTDAVTSEICSSINGKNLISTECAYCDSRATSIDLSTLDTRNVVNMARMFADSDVTSLDLSNFDTSHVTDMSSMFGNVQVLNLDLSSFDTRNVTNMAHMFNGSKVTSLDLRNFSTSRVTKMEAMFASSHASNINLSNFDTSHVTDMSYMFHDCQTLGELNLSSFDTSNVENMDAMFYGCYKLVTIYVSNLWNTDNVNYSDEMFFMCSNLVGGAETSYQNTGISDISYARIDDPDNGNPGYFTYRSFTGRSCVFNGELTDGVEYADGIYTYGYRKEGWSNDWNYISEDGWGVILTNKDSTDPVITQPCVSINGKPIVSMSYMFVNSNAESIDLSKFNTSSVTNMEAMFADSHASNINLSSFDTSNVTNMSSMFYESEITSLDLSSFDTSNVTDMSNMFSYNSNLMTIYVSDLWTTSNISNGGNMFNDCYSLEGGSGTRYETAYISDYTYARIDDPDNGEPGYFTSKDGGGTGGNVGKACYYGGGSKDELYDGLEVIDGLYTYRYKEENWGNDNWYSISEDGWGVVLNDKNATDVYDELCSTINGMPIVSMRNMFNGSQAENIDLSSFNTSNVTNMSGMFENTQHIYKLDLSSFNINKLEFADSMFANSSVSVILVSNKWNYNRLIDYSKSSEMFASTYNLVGENGTSWSDSNPTDATYARIDDPDNGLPGYFTYNDDEKDGKS